MWEKWGTEHRVKRSVTILMSQEAVEGTWGRLSWTMNLYSVAWRGKNTVSMNLRVRKKGKVEPGGFFNKGLVKGDKSN